MPERILEADLDAELLRRNRLGESHAALARAFGCSKSLVQRRIARAAKLEERRLADERDRDKATQGQRAAGLDRTGGSVTADLHTGSIREILDARIRDPKTSARDLASLTNALARLDAEEIPAPDGDLRVHLLAARRRIRELEAAQLRLPRLMPGVEEWFVALPTEVEDWMQLPDAPVELLDQDGHAHHVVAEDARFFVEHLGWRTPPVWEPDDDVIEEWRARIAEYDARRSERHSPLPSA